MENLIYKLINVFFWSTQTFLRKPPIKIHHFYVDYEWFFVVGLYNENRSIGPASKLWFLDRAFASCQGLNGSQLPCNLSQLSQMSQMDGNVNSLDIAIQLRFFQRPRLHPLLPNKWRVCCRSTAKGWGARHPSGQKNHLAGSVLRILEVSCDFHIHNFTYTIEMWNYNCKYVCT